MNAANDVLKQQLLEKVTDLSEARLQLGGALLKEMSDELY